MGMTAVFTAPPQFTVLAGRQEVGRTDPMLLTEKTDGPRLLLLGGRSWKVTWTDWETPPVLRRARSGWRQGPLAHARGFRCELRAGPGRPGSAARGRSAGGLDPAGQADPG